MDDHWLTDMLPRPVHKGYGPSSMPQNYPPANHYDDPMMGWIQVYNGDQAWPLDMERTKIDIEDIAHALSMKVRFTGHCTKPYSIAQHCVHVMELVPVEDRREALMHDAAEYVLPDVATPIKPALPGFKALEKQVEAAIAKRFNLRFPNPPSIKMADNAMVLFERQRLMKPALHAHMVWTVPGEPAHIPYFKVWPWETAKAFFLFHADRLGLQ